MSQYREQKTINLILKKEMLMRFIRRLSVKHHPTGDHYVLSVPAQVAQAIGLDKEDGLVSLSVDEGVAVTLQAYRDSEIAWREKFDPTVKGHYRGVPVPPNCLGRSRPTVCGRVRGLPDIKELHAALVWCRAEMKRILPSRRGRPRRRR